MNILAIDTSTKNLSLALAQDADILKCRNRKLQRPLSSSIMPGVRDILKCAGMALEQLDGFVIGLGPGSFTGLRVGLSTVKGLVFAVNKPVVGISSLDALALGVKENDVQVCALCDAKRNMAYACAYHKTAAGLRRLCDYTLAEVKDILKHIKGKTVFVGDGVQLFKDEIRLARGITPVFLEGEVSIPQARHLIPLALPRLKNGKQDDIDTLVPMYLYPEHCQVRR